MIRLSGIQNISQLQLERKRNPSVNADGWHFELNDKFDGWTYDKITYHIYSKATGQKIQSYIDDVLNILLQSGAFDSPVQLPDGRAAFNDYLSRGLIKKYSGSGSAGNNHFLWAGIIGLVIFSIYKISQ